MSIRDELALAICKAQCNGGRPAGIDYAAADAILARFGVVELDDDSVPDDDGQEWFNDYEIRVDHTGLYGPEVWIGGHQTTPEQLRRIAVAYLTAAKHAKAQS
ncbi:hypothetical protein [Rhodococcus sp. 11-3]|uniref:hypothetical protein n=1 Tax=Rhodococcus sp. 11-3 TaxID=2854796 RepID=UPI00203A7C4F|nr:hypothetical protein [Rhodococcus sp. 11-3]USC16201.1 hypothetical protein KZJ41_04560 [Rhodococcus sp. 11-3]